MEEPEKLAMIGGSILLASTLIFTLKSQAGSILPKVEHPIDNIYSHVGDAQSDSDFNEAFQSAQEKGWRTGHWGTAKYYIDDQANMYVGRGKLQSGDTLRATLRDGNTDVLHSLNIVQPLQLPSDSSNLLSTSNWDVKNRGSLQEINGLDKLDTSQVTNMHNMFTNDYNLKHINGLEDWDVSHVNNMTWMFNNDNSLQDVDVTHWDVSNVQDMGFMFNNDMSLTKLDLSGWDNSHANQMTRLLGYETSLKTIALSNKVHLNSTAGINGGSWSNNGQTLSDAQIQDSNVHPGTWTYQGQK